MTVSCIDISHWQGRPIVFMRRSEIGFSAGLYPTPDECLAAITENEQ